MAVSLSSLAAVLSLVMALNPGRTHALTQEYCSSENTGSDYSSVYSIYQSNGFCFTQCVSGYAFAVVQNENCWCSNYIPADQVSISNCNQNCTGYPSENCGNSNTGLYGYVALSKSPSGTAGSSSPTTSSTSTSTSTASQQTTTAAPTTTTTSSAVATTTPQTTTVSPSPSPSPSSSQTPQETTVVSTVTQTPSTTSTTPTTTASATEASMTAMVSTQVVTVSGAIVTQTVTSTVPRTSSSATVGADKVRPTKEGVNTGTIVGAVVGAIVGLAAIALILFVCLRRRRRDSVDGGSNRSVRKTGLDRNASILSRAGLIPSARDADAEKSIDDPRFGSQRQSALYAENDEPTIGTPATTYEPGNLVRRESRPLVYDQRLNPAALMQNWELNGSRASVNTMQDQRDYSRPLGITNPDMVDRD